MGCAVLVSYSCLDLWNSVLLVQKSAKVGHGQVENIQFSYLIRDSQQIKMEFACLQLRFFI
jgi:hypothetical protein